MHVITQSSKQNFFIFIFSFQLLTVRGYSGSHGPHIIFVTGFTPDDLPDAILPFLYGLRTGTGS